MAILGLNEYLRLKKMKPENFWKEEKQREKSLVLVIIFYYWSSWEAQVAFRPFQTSTVFAPENLLLAWAAPF